MKRQKYLLLLSLLALSGLASAQSFYAVRRERTLMVTAGTGSATYYGELSNPGSVFTLQPNLNVGLQGFVTPRINIRAEMNWFRLSGSDAQASSQARKARGLSFHTNCFELTTIGAINLFANGNRYYRRQQINFYGFAGIGLLYFNPQAELNGKTYNLEPLHTEGVSYSRVVPVIPFGLGMRLKMGPNTNIVIEGGYRKTFTDYLDDVSSKYIAPTSDPIRNYFINPNNPAYNTLTSIPPGEQNNYNAGSKRGDPTHFDSYFLLNIKVEYYLPMREGYSRGNGLLFGKKRSSMYRYKRSGGLRRR
ncbi:MAG: outer membrane beta-barrel protein [Bacteroidetes bacterium]|nr:outer membrane beta-barrel protein [Bacteroidota bacterium]MBS1541771.1 outer membrane beta-barrel protein [Bacteroidota bacterium]